MKKLATLLAYPRSRWDYRWYLIRHRQGYALALLTFLLTVAAFVAAPVAGELWLTVVGFVLLVGTIGSWLAGLHVLKSYNRLSATVPFAQLSLPAPLKRFDLRRSTGPDEFGAYLPLSDFKATGLTEGSIKAEWDSATYRLPAPMKSVAAGVLYGVYRASNAPHFNSVVVRQNNDLRPGQAVQLSACRYFDLLTTNYLATSVIEQPAGTQVLDGRSALYEDQSRPDGHRSMKVGPLGGSVMANAIGVSTLAFTKGPQPHVFLVRQSFKSSSSAGLWAPSGSGSLDARDVGALKSGSPSNLQTILVAGMERELLEESHLESTDINETRLVGYFRWLNKGAKPEYVGVTKLNFAYDAGQVFKPRFEEHPWVKQVSVATSFDFARFQKVRNPIEGLPVEFADPWLIANKSEVRSQASFPLYAALYLLQKRLIDTDSSFKDWLLS